MDAVDGTEPTALDVDGAVLPHPNGRLLDGNAKWYNLTARRRGVVGENGGGHTPSLLGIP